MNISIKLTEKPINPRIHMPVEFCTAAGAWAEFRGIVRGEESGRPILALEYQAYDTMAVSVMRQIAQTLGEAHPFLFFQAIHRIGVVPVGEAAIYIGVAAKHRKSAFAVLSAFMDRLKQDVPIWKIQAIEGGRDPLDAAGAETAETTLSK